MSLNLLNIRFALVAAVVVTGTGFAAASPVMPMPTVPTLPPPHMTAASPVTPMPTVPTIPRSLMAAASPVTPMPTVPTLPPSHVAA